MINARVEWFVRNLLTGAKSFRIAMSSAQPLLFRGILSGIAKQDAALSRGTEAAAAAFALDGGFYPRKRTLESP